MPIVVVIAFFSDRCVARQPIPNLGEIALGTLFVMIGLAMFVRGPEMGCSDRREHGLCLYSQGPAQLAAAVCVCTGVRNDRGRTGTDRSCRRSRRGAAVGKMIETHLEATESYADGLRVTVALSVGFAILVACCASSVAGRSTHPIIAGYIG